MTAYAKPDIMEQASSLGHRISSMWSRAYNSETSFESRLGLQLAAVLTILVVSFFFFIFANLMSQETIPVVNRSVWFEPSFFARLRWGLRAGSILDEADKKAQGRPYLLVRGDKDIIVLPVSVLPELNRLGPDVLDARKSHAFAFVAHLTGLEMTATAKYQTQILQRRVSPALSDYFPSMAARMSVAIQSDFPASEDWTEMKPLEALVDCVSQGMSLVLFGTEASKSSDVIRAAVQLTEDLFAVALTMRLVPSILQRVLVWLLPGKWRLNRRWRELKTLLTPEIDRLRQETVGPQGESLGTDLLSWMVRDGATAFEQDTSVLTTLCGSVATGSIFSVANLACHMIADLAAHPDVLEEVRSEIRTMHTANDGRPWDLAALNGLDKLDSAMKETSRLASSPIIVYSRIAQQDCVVGGVRIKKGQSITLSARQRTMDPDLFENPEAYNGLRFCQSEDKLKEHRIHAFRTVDTNILTWGAGRAACPGRLIADAATKVLLVKLIDEYDFSLVDGERPIGRGALHEFVFFEPDNKLLVRRRRDGVGIGFQ